MSTDMQKIAAVAAQIGSRLDDDTDKYIHRFLVESRSSDKLYRVSQKRSDGTWCCSCPQWTMRPDKVTGKRKCPHLTDILHRLAKLATSGELDAEVLAMLESARTAYLDMGGQLEVRHVESAGREIDW
jgi:hypothetical protein